MTRQSYPSAGAIIASPADLDQRAIEKRLERLPARGTSEAEIRKFFRARPPADLGYLKDRRCSCHRPPPDVRLVRRSDHALWCRTCWQAQRRHLAAVQRDSGGWAPEP